MPVDHALQIGANGVEVGGRRGGHVGAPGIVGLQRQQRLPGFDLIAGRDMDGDDAAAAIGQQDMLHLHRLEHGHWRAGAEPCADRHVQLRDACGHWRTHDERTGSFEVRGLDLVRPRRRCPLRGALSVFERGLRLEGRGFGQQRVEVSLDESGVHLLALELRPRRNRPQEPEVGRDAFDPALGEGSARTSQHGREVRLRRVHHELGQQRVVARRRHESGKGMRVATDPRPARPVQGFDAAARRTGRARRTDRFGVDAPLHGEAASIRRLAGHESELAQRCAGGEPELHLHQIQAGHRFAHRVLDLKAGIGLDEEPGRCRGVGVDEEFESAQIAVAHLAGQAQCGARERVAQSGGQGRRGRDLDQLLEAPLQRAFALAQAGDARTIAGDLDLDVAGACQPAFDVDAVDTESGPRLGPATLVGFGQVVRALHDAHAAATAAGHGLDHHAPRAVGELLGEKGAGGRKRDCARRRRQQRHAAAAGKVARPRLVAEERELLRGRADEEEAGRGAGIGERRLFAQEAVARVNRIAAASPCRRHQPRAIEVSGCAGAGQGLGARRLPDVRGVRVVLGKDGDAFDAAVGCGARDAHGDLAAVGNEEAADHGQMLRGQTPILGRGGTAAGPALSRLRVPLADARSVA